MIYPVSVIGGRPAQTGLRHCCVNRTHKTGDRMASAVFRRRWYGPTGDAPAAPDGKCLTAARAAIDVNNRAFRQFGFGGTPWVLSDTGWHLPSGILKDATTVACS